MNKDYYKKNNKGKTYTQLSLDLLNKKDYKQKINNIVNLNKKREKKEKIKEKNLEKEIIQNAIDFSKSLDW